MESSHPMIDVHGLKNYFAIKSGNCPRVSGYVKAVDGIDLRILPGETYGLVGESDCGQFTAGLTILKLLQPIAGRVELTWKRRISIGFYSRRNLK